MSAIPLAATRNPAETIAPTLSNDQLAARLAAKPALLIELQNQALGLYNQVRILPGITAGIDAIWGDFRTRTVQAERAAAPSFQRADAARIALEASALFGDLLSLQLPRPDALATYDAPHLTGQIADTPEARALLESRPSTKAWLEARDAGKALAADRHQQHVERTNRDAPQNFLAMVRQRGVDLQLDDAGNIIAPPGTDMSKLLPTEIASIKDWKPELVALLQAEEAARGVHRPDKPTVLA